MSSAIVAVALVWALAAAPLTAVTTVLGVTVVGAKITWYTLKGTAACMTSAYRYMSSTPPPGPDGMVPVATGDHEST